MIDSVGLFTAVVLPVRSNAPDATPGASDLERFRMAIAESPAPGAASVPSGADSAAVSVQAAGQAPISGSTSSGSEPTTPRTLGDAILQGLQSASNDITRAWAGTGEVLNKPDITVSDMLRVQTMLLQSAVQYELVGKAVSKSTQSIENILKTQ
jgi:type III secretion protein I